MNRGSEVTQSPCADFAGGYHTFITCQTRLRRWRCLPTAWGTVYLLLASHAEPSLGIARA